ncbi:hypothetical protein KAH94_02495 [bacterium]|nr:hypothetical protein [bacterium]
MYKKVMYVFFSLLMSGNLFGMSEEVTQKNKKNENIVATTNDVNTDAQIRLAATVRFFNQYVSETSSEVRVVKKEEKFSVNFNMVFPEKFCRGIKVVVGEIKQDINKVKKGIKDIKKVFSFNPCAGIDVK